LIDASLVLAYYFPFNPYTHHDELLYHSPRVSFETKKHCFYLMVNDNKIQLGHCQVTASKMVFDASSPITKQIEEVVETPPLAELNVVAH